MCTIFVHCALVWGSWAAAHSPLFGWFMVLKMRNFLRGALPRTPLGLPAPDPRLGLRPRPRVRRCRRPEAELRLQAKVARCRLSSKKIAMYFSTSPSGTKCKIAVKEDYWQRAHTLAIMSQEHAAWVASLYESRPTHGVGALRIKSSACVCPHPHTDTRTARACSRGAPGASAHCPGCPADVVSRLWLVY